MTNIIILTVDALRVDFISAYGHENETSPKLDALCEQGAKFTNAFSTSSHTREAIPSMVTGQYPSVAIKENFQLGSESFATLLKNSPFQTAAFHSNPYVSRAYEYDRDFDRFYDDLYFGHSRLGALAQRALDKLRNRHYARADKINQLALDWLNDLQQDSSFVLWNHYMDVHGPYEPPEPHRSRFLDKTVSDRAAQRLFQKAVKRPDSVTPEEAETLKSLYEGEVSYVDEKIGDFVETVESRGLLDDTLLIISSDHGEAFGENGYFEHPRRLEDELLRIPLIVLGPWIEPSSIDFPVSLVDVVPTILEAVGMDATDLPGVPLQRIIEGQSVNENRIVFAEARGLGDSADLRRYKAQNISEQLIHERHAGTKLGADELSTDNLLSASLRDFIASGPDTDVAIEADEPSQVKDRLEALGYK